MTEGGPPAAPQRKQGRLSEKPAVSIAAFLVCLAVASVITGAIQNQGRANLTDCINTAIIQGGQAFRARDRIEIDLNEINKDAVHARERLFTVLVRVVKNENVPIDDINSAYQNYLTTITRYENGIDRYTQAINNASVLSIEACE